MSSDLNKMLDDLEQAIDKLKIRYEQYFMGLERFEPLKNRRAVDRAIRFLRSQVISNTSQKFRFRMLMQRYTTYKTYWNRVQRQIEEGTHRRDLARIQRDLKKKGVESPDLMKARNAGEVEAALTRSMRALKEKNKQEAQKAHAANAANTTATATPAENEIKKATPPPLPIEALQSKAATRAATNGSGQTAGRRPGGDKRLRRVYEAYLAARRKTGESNKGLTFDKMVQSIQKQLPKIQKEHGSQEVEFSVEVRKGRAVLKALPRK
jgi:hypothetical protein